MNYKKIYYDLADKIDLLSIRERILVLITSIVAVLILWQILIFDQIDYFKVKISNNANKMQQQISNLQGQITQVSTSLSFDPVIRLEEQIKKLYKENEELKNKLFNMKAKLISPAQMMLILKNILDNKSLEVLSLKNLPLTPVLSNLEQQEDEEDANLTFKVYKHGLEIVMNGSFFQVRDFLLEAENLPYKLSWDELEFSITEYPVAKIKIIIGALSVNTSLIGSVF